MSLSLALGFSLALQSSAVTVDRGAYEIHCGVVGRGQPVVAIPGGPGFGGRAVWGIGFGMRETCRTYLFDQLGTGGSKLKDGRASLPDTLDPFRTVEDLEAVRRSQGHRKWTVVGQSWGAIVALIYAAKHPEAVEHLVLTSLPGLGHNGTVLGTNLAKRIPPSLDSELVRLQKDLAMSEEELVAWQMTLAFPYYFYEPSIGLRLITNAPQGMFSVPVFMGLRRHILNDAAYRDQLNSLKAANYPVTLIQGHQDPCGAAMPYLLRQSHLHGAEVHLIDRCGHFPWIEQPSFFFSILHRALKLPEPKWLKEAEEFDSAAVEAEARLRERIGWPFGPKRI